MYATEYRKALRAAGYDGLRIVELSQDAVSGEEGEDPGIDIDTLPIPGDHEAEAAIRAAIVHLHDRVLGRDDAADSPEVDRTYALFAGIVADAEARGNVEPREIYHCRDGNEQRVPDPHYTIRAWRAVVTYLLRQHEFLYE